LSFRSYFKDWTTEEIEDTKEDRQYYSQKKKKTKGQSVMYKNYTEN